jgi:hypothetical protein
MELRIEHILANDGQFFVRIAGGAAVLVLLCTPDPPLPRFSNFIRRVEM